MNSKSKVNYNEISQIYDDVRQADVELINCFLQEIETNTGINVLDLGCGTGNHTDLLQKASAGNVYGVEPSAGMLSKARQKNKNIVFKQGDAENIPFEDELFDLVVMTDVIHHVPDISKMFAEIHRVLKTRGKICIMTQSHKQIENRPIVQFFPGTATVDKARYHEVDKIVATARAQNFNFIKNTALYENEEVELGPDFLELVKKKGFSMLHLISDEAYNKGLKRLEITLKAGPIRAKSAGETLIWFMVTTQL